MGKRSACWKRRSSKRGQWKTRWVAASMAEGAHTRRVRSWRGALGEGRGKAAFAFGAKVTAAGPEAAEGGAVFAV